MVGPLLLKNLREAVEMTKKCEDTCKDFEVHRSPEIVNGWKLMKRMWELDPSKPDPYRVIEKGKLTLHAALLFLILALVASNFSSAKRKIIESEALDPNSNNSPPHKLSPFSFIRMGLEIEDQQ